MHANNVASQGVLYQCIHSVAHCMLCYPQRLTGKAEVACIEEQLKSRCNALALLQAENLKYEQNIEDYKMKRSDRYTFKANKRKETQHPLFVWPLMCA